MTKRVPFIDLAKGFCIKLVVWHHIASTWGLSDYLLKLPLSTFRMPLYFFLSGLFFKNYNGFFDFFERKINKLLIPFIFFFITTSCLLPFALAHFSLRQSPNSNIWFSFIWEQQFPNLPIWFLLGLFWTNIAFYILFLISKKISEKYFTVILTIFSLSVGATSFFIGRTGINLPMFIDSSLTSLPYFCAGFITFRYSHFLEQSKYDKYSLVYALLLFTLVFILSKSTVSYIDNRFNLPIVTTYLCGICGTIGVLSLAKFFKQIPLISYFGKFSIMILVTHGWILWALIKIEREFYLLKRIPQNISLALIFCITMLLYLAIIPFMRKFLPYVTAQKDVLSIMHKV